MQDLLIELNHQRKELTKAISILKERGQAKSLAEKEYRIALAKEMLELRTSGFPATILSDLARGKEEIAELKMQRDISETLWESAMQYIYATKINIGILENQINAERKGI